MDWQRFKTFCQRKTSASFDNDNKLSLSGSLVFLQCFFFSKTSEIKMERPICAIVLVGNKNFLFLSPVKWMSNCFSCTCFGYSKNLYSLRFLGNWLDVTLQLGVTEIAQICMLNEKWNVKNNSVLAGVSFPLCLRGALLALDACIFILLPNVRLSSPIVRFRMQLLFF